MTAIMAAAASLTLSACAHQAPAQVEARNNFATLPAPVQPIRSPSAPDYRIGPNDKLDIIVFQQKDLSLEKVRVDAGGRILFPLIGSVQAGGKTTTELAESIRVKLAERYLQDPNVSVQVDEAAGLTITVDGVVTQPGVYNIQGRTSLMQAVALAKGPARDADLKRVAVFRQVDERRMAAVFDLAAIREGRLADPELQGGDIVVVTGSPLRGFWRELVTSLPALGVFAFF